MARRSKAFEQNQRDRNGGWQPADPRAAEGFICRANNAHRHINELDPTRTVVVDMDRFKDIMRDDPNMAIATVIRDHVMPTIHSSALSYRSHEIVVIKAAEISEEDRYLTVRRQDQHGLAFVFKRPRHAMLFKLMWG